MFDEAAKVLGTNGKAKTHMWSQFWHSCQLFFKHLCLGAKTAATVELAKQAISEGMAVVIALQSTGESLMRESKEYNSGNLDNFISPAK